MSDEAVVDDELEQQQGNWEFDAEVASQFDKHIRKSIPLYDEIQHRVTGTELLGPQQPSILTCFISPLW